MRPLGIALLAYTLCSTGAHATDREFTDIVRAISDEFHTRPLHIPMFGLVNFVTYVVRPAGTKHIDLAVFENLGPQRHSDRDLAGMIQGMVGGAWKPFVQVRSHRNGGEMVFIYMRPDGRDCKLLLTTIEPNEATVIQLKLNPDALERWLREPRYAAMHRHGNSN